MAPPERPAGLPEGGFWNPDVGRWEVSRRSAQGAREGECLFFLPDGTLQARRHFAAGVQDGPFALFHRDGSVAREGRFAAGRIEGVVTAYSGDGDGADPLRACCVPASATRLELLFDGGEVVQEVFFDRAGQPILSDGRPRPPIPAGVPSDVVYDETGACWTRRRPRLHQVWSAAGALQSEIDLDGGFQRVVRTFGADGRLEASRALARDGTCHGAFARRFPADGGSPYADPSFREERGTFDGGQAVGVWSFHDAEGTERRRVQRGVRFNVGDERTSPAFAPGVGMTAEGWRALEQSLRAEGRVREALCATARAAARDVDRAALERTLAADIPSLRPEEAAARGDALVRAVDATPAAVLEGLLCGADAAAAFRALAAVLPGASHAASDFVAASLLLAPDRPMTHLTRALIRFQHGDEAGARADIARIATEVPDAARSLTGYLDIALRSFAFWPAHEPLAPDPELAELGAGVARELDEVRAAIALYATRLGALRRALRALIGPDVAPSRLPPDLSGLLPDGPVGLRRGRFPAPLVEDDPGAPTEVDVDEQLTPDGLGVPALLGEAQADWGALCWLCWSAGLDRVALPEDLAEPPLFAVAMKTIVTRCWRAQDRVKTGGLLARANSVPGFVWQGLDIDALPQPLAQSVAEEYLRARAVFLWLASPEVLSPFQVDLRQG